MLIELCDVVYGVVVVLIVFGVEFVDWVVIWLLNIWYWVVVCLVIYYVGVVVVLLNICYIVIEVIDILD